MAWPSVTTASATPVTGTPTTITWNHTCTAGDTKLVVLVAHGESTARTVSTVTYGGTSMSLVGRHRETAGNNFEATEIWELDNPTTGSSLAVLATLSGAGEQIGGGSASISEAATGSGNRTYSSGQGTSNNPSLAVTTVSGNLLLSVLASDGGTGATAGGTSIFDNDSVASDSDFNGQYQSATGTTTTASWTETIGAGAWSVSAVVLVSAGVAGIAAPWLRM